MIRKGVSSSNASKSCGREGDHMPDVGSRVVLGGGTFVKSRTGDTLECHALGSPLSTICEWPFVSPNTVGCMVCVCLRFSPCCG
jgi:hypothetical protein